MSILLPINGSVTHDNHDSWYSSLKDNFKKKSRWQKAAIIGCGCLIAAGGSYCVFKSLGQQVPVIPPISSNDKPNDPDSGDEQGQQHLKEEPEDAPASTKESQDDGGDKSTACLSYDIGSHSIEGRRHSQQDAHQHIQLNNGNEIIVVCDGHGCDIDHKLWTKLSEFSEDTLKKYAESGVNLGEYENEHGVIDCAAVVSSVAVKTIVTHLQQHLTDVSDPVKCIHDAILHAENTLHQISGSPYNEDGFTVYHSVGWNAGTTVLSGIFDKTTSTVTVAWACWQPVRPEF